MKLSADQLHTALGALRIAREKYIQNANVLRCMMAEVGNPAPFDAERIAAQFERQAIDAADLIGAIDNFEPSEDA